MTPASRRRLYAISKLFSDSDYTYRRSNYLSDSRCCLLQCMKRRLDMHEVVSDEDTQEEKKKHVLG